MTAREFRAWMAEMDLNGRQVADRLGRSQDTIAIWRRDGVSDRDAKLVALARAALSAGVKPRGEVK